jgi:eukaryotic-like serine/threonine-protein kinase
LTDPNPSDQGAPDPLVGTTVAERYRIERLLGSGGMGAVYLAEHVHMRKPVALKVLHKELAGVNEVVARFEREAIAAGRVEHPNVAPATDFGKLDDGSFYLVLEYVDGKSLRDLIAEGPLAWERAVAIARQIVSALVAAHAAGIVHRDLKPDNVMLVAQPDGSERVKVLDFGIARVTLAEPQRDVTHLTKVGAVMGTVAYMSPEQALGEEVDERTDLYALGVIVHEMITGRVPFDADSAAQILAKQITQNAPPLPPGSPAPLAALVTELLGKTRVERPPSARAVLERLDGLGTPSSAPAVAGAATASAKDPKKLVIGVGLAIGLAAALGIAALSGEGASTAEPAAVTSGAAPSPPSVPSEASPKRIGERAERTPSGEPSAVDATSAGPSASTPSASTASSTSRGAPAARSTSKKKQQSAPADTSKKRTGPGGIYIPPPSQWF